jgi:hypothetical protein
MLIKSIAEVTKREPNFWSQPLEYDRRGASHRLFQYPAMMLPVVQRKLIELIKTAAPATHSLLDPFMGSGTALVAGMLNGLDCYGQDINPLSILLAKVKAEALDYPAYKIAAAALQGRMKLDDCLTAAVEFPRLSKWFEPVVVQELSKLVRAIRQEDNQTTRRLFWVTLAETIRLTSNDRTSTFKLHARPLDEIAARETSPLTTFQQLLKQNIKDIALYATQLTEQGTLQQYTYSGKVCIQVVDSSLDIKRPVAASATQPGFDLLVSSPPYGDNRTTVPYGQHAFLPLQWIDFEDIDPAVSRASLRTTHEIDNQSLGGKQRTVTTQDEIRFSTLSPTLKANLLALRQSKPLEVKKVVGFVRDLNAVLERCAKALKTNGYMVWTIGNRKVGGVEVQNNLILQDLLRHHQVLLLQTIERSIKNKRMARRNKTSATMMKEEILIFRKH